MFQGLPSEKKYRVGLVDMQSIDYGTRFRVTDPRTGKHADLTPDESGLLMFSTTFQTLKRHVEIYTNRYSVKSDEIPRLLRVLHSCADLRLLIEENELKNILSQAVSNHPAEITNTEKISIIGIPTRNRPKELERCITSFMENVTRYGRTPEFVIADDSDGEFLRQNETMLAHIQKKYSGKITHFTLEKRKAFAKSLARQKGVPEEIVLFGITGDYRDTNHIGALRNSILLYGKSRKVLFTDDDVICSLHALPDYSDKQYAKNLNITSAPPRPSWFFKSYEEAINYFPEIEADYLVLHEELLGKSVGILACLHSRENVDFSDEIGGISNNLLKTIYDGTFLNTKIAVTYPSSLGHSWMRFHSPVMATRLFQEQGLLGNSKQNYESNKITPHIARFADGNTVYKGNECFGLSMAVDTTFDLPPFAPRFVNEDACFGFLLQNLSPNYVAAFIPEAVEHRRVRPHVPNSDILSSFCSTNALTVSLLSLTTSLSGVATVSDDDFRDVIMQAALKRCSAFIEYAKYTLAYYSSDARVPNYWFQDIETSIQSIELALVQPKFEFLPFFLDVSRTGQKFGLQEFRQWIQQFGIFLSEWQKLFK